MRIASSAVARRVEPPDAFAWWTDFEGGHVGHGTLIRTRRTVRPGPAPGEVAMEDRVVGLPFRERLVARPDRDALVLRFAGENTVSRFEGLYRFAPSPGGGTEVALEGDVRLKAALRWSEFVAAPLARRLLARDLAAHVRDMEGDLSP